MPFQGSYIKPVRTLMLTTARTASDSPPLPGDEVLLDDIQVAQITCGGRAKKLLGVEWGVLLKGFERCRLGIENAWIRSFHNPPPVALHSTSEGA